MPYLALIALYFFFINIEAKKNKNFQRSIEVEKNLTDEEGKSDEKIFKVVIPVIPYNQ
tara:strand:- start:675 stop:848 length:174 start_codon:yes stop_codon:yes gene_type:complete